MWAIQKSEITMKEVQICDWKTIKLENIKNFKQLNDNHKCTVPQN